MIFLSLRSIEQSRKYPIFRGQTSNTLTKRKRVGSVLFIERRRTERKSNSYDKDNCLSDLVMDNR